MRPRTAEQISLAAVGDIILHEPNPAHFFRSAREVLKGHDVGIAHIEVPHTERGTEQPVKMPTMAASPQSLAAVREAGFDVATLAANHIFDLGPEGVVDTRSHARAAGLLPTGAGADIEEAHEPALMLKRGLRIATLSYNCVGPRLSWAGPNKAGSAYIEILTHYDMPRYGSPGARPTIATWPEPKSLAAAKAKVRAVKELSDICVVSLHKGVTHVPETILEYEIAVSHELIDAGADVIIGHHAHILRGIEFYRSKPIFHGLGNFVTVTRTLNVEGNPHPIRREWAKKRRDLYDFSPDPALETFPFHPEGRHTIIASVNVSKDGSCDAGFFPCYIDDDGTPVPLEPRSSAAQRTVDYVERITETAGFATAFRWSGSRVLCSDVDGAAQ